MTSPATIAALLHVEETSDDTPIVIARHGGARITHHPDCTDIVNADEIRPSTWGEREGFIDACFEVSTSVFSLGSKSPTFRSSGGTGTGTGSTPVPALASDKQVAFIRSLMASAGVSEEEVMTFVDTQGTKSGIDKLTKSEASSVISHLKNRPAAAPADAPAAATPAVDMAATERFLIGLGRKVEVTDITPELIASATAWAQDYRGDFSFMIDMRDAATRRPLSAGQAKGTLNCLRADIDRNGPSHATAPAATTDDAPIDLSDLPAGLYAVPGGDTRLKVEISHPTSAKWSGWTFVNDGAEYGSGRKYGRQAPGKSYTGDIKDELRAILADPREAMAAYGRLTNHCGVCGRKLETEASVERGIGPECAKRF